MRGIGLWLALAGCAEALTTPAPTLSGLEPALVCVEQLTTPVTLTGSDLVPLPSELVAEPPTLLLPAISVSRVSTIEGADAAGGAVAVDARWTDPQTIGFDVVPDLGLEGGVYDVTVTGPDGASDTLPASLAGVPAPVAETIAPDRVCLDQGTREVVVFGSGFLDVGGALPTFSVGSFQVAADAVEGCVPLAGPVSGQRCDTVRATLPADGLIPPGDHDVVVTNPETAACTTAIPLSISVYEAPVLTSAEPSLLCDDASVSTIVLSGSGFLVIDGILPNVSIGAAFSRPADRIVGCGEAVDGVAVCDTLEVDVAAGDLPPGLHGVVVSNPDPVGCATSEVVNVEIVASPTIAALTPAATCTDAGDVELVIDGTGFLEIGGVPPEVALDGIAFVPVLETCVALLGDVTGSVCDRLRVTVPAGTFPTPGTVEVVVSNPTPAECDTAVAEWEVGSRPTITDVEPDAICDDGETLVVTGTGFTTGSQVLVGGIDTTETFVSDTELWVTLPADLGAGVYDVTVSNGFGCDATLPGGLSLVGLPYVFYVDPPVVYSAIPVRATVYVSGVNGDVVDAWLESAADGTIVPVPFAWDPADPGVVQIDVPAGLAEGSWHVTLTDGYACDPSLLDAIFVEADLTLALDAIEPPYGWTAADTSTRLTASAGGLLDVPRVYLSPVVPGPGATELRGVSLADPTAIDAVVPSGLPIGSYDVLVVNPDGQIGALPGGFEVVAGQPPIVESVSPGSLPNDGVYPILLAGEGFAGSGGGPPTVVADCVDPDSGAAEQVVATVTAFDDTSIDALLDADLGIGTGICVLSVTDDDGTTGTYSAISVTNPSQNLYAWRAAPPLLTGRRAPAAVAGRVTPTQRYLFALGGDDGAGAPWDDVEAAQVDPYGALGAWSQLPTRLPAPRTLAGAALVGRYLYLVGGTDGATAQATTWRAQILDPLAAPEFTGSVVFALGTGVELPVGTWVYRVSAVFDPSDDENPGGESLPSDPFVVRVPDVPERIALTLSWGAVPGATAYRLYRSSGTGGEELLLETAATTAVDVGAPTDPAIVPLPPGSIGQWRALAPMASAREGACVAVAADPSDGSRYWLMAAGGRDAAGGVRDDIELLPITVVADDDHDAGAWSTSAFALSSARWQCSAYAATSALNPSVPAGETWVYFGGGLDAAGDIAPEVDALLVGSADFDLAFAVADMRQRAGYVSAVANDFLYALGGGNASPDSAGESSAICGTGDPGCNDAAVPEPPEIGNWNGLGGGTLLEARYLAGSAQESSVIFAVGGQTPAAAASTSVEYTNF